MDTKACSMCKSTLPISEFYKHNKNRDGLQAFCKQCKKTYSNAYRKKNADRINKRRRDSKEHIRAHLRRRYDISEAQYNAMHTDQNGACAICGNSGVKLYVDHCHTTNKIRGLLCQQCNSMLGFSRDSILFLESAVTYLLKTSS